MKENKYMSNRDQDQNRDMSKAGRQQGQKPGQPQQSQNQPGHKPGQPDSTRGSHRPSGGSADQAGTDRHRSGH